MYCVITLLYVYTYVENMLFTFEDQEENKIKEGEISAY